MHEIRRMAWPLAVLVLAGTALATPPKPGRQDVPGTGTAMPAKGDQSGPEGRAERNAMALRGGVSEDVWLEGLRRVSRVPSPRREEITRLVRRYIVEASAFRADQAPVLKRLTQELLAARAAGEPVPRELTSRIRAMRRARPKLSDLQRAVWDLLTGPEETRLVETLTELKRTGLPKDVQEGRRPAGSPARVTTPTEPAGDADETAKPATDAEPKKAPPPLLWSFVDDPNAGKPLPEPEPSDATARPDASD